MAIGVVKLSFSQRKKLAKAMYILNGIQIFMALMMISAALFIYFHISPSLYSEKPEVRFVFVVLCLSGFQIAFHYLMGIKMTSKSLRQPEKKSTRGLLLLWICAGLYLHFTLIVLAIMGRKIGHHISRSMKYSFRYGMHHYLSNTKWKEAIDSFQYDLACCGIEGYQDWHEIPWLTKYHVSESNDLVKKFTNPVFRTYTVTPWSCCKIDFPMQCLHDPLQQIHSTHVWDDEPKVAQDSINTNGCLGIIEKPIFAVINIFAVCTAFLFIIYLILFFLSRILYTASRNALLLNDPEGLAPGWIFGRGDCGYTRGKSVYDIMMTTEKFNVSKYIKRKKKTTVEDSQIQENETFQTANESVRNELLSETET